ALVDRRERPGTMPDGGGLLAGDADDEARDVDEVHHRQMEGLAEIDETSHLVAGIGRPATAIEEGIARQHRDRPAVEPRQAGDDRTAPHLADLEEAAAIDAGLDDGPHAIDLAAIARDRLDQRRLA